MSNKVHTNSPPVPLEDVCQVMISVSTIVLPHPHLSLYKGKVTGFDCFGVLGVFPVPRSLFPVPLDKNYLLKSYQTSSKVTFPTSEYSY